MENIMASKNQRTRKVVPNSNAPKNSKVAVFIDNENTFYGALHNAESFPIYLKIMDKAKDYGSILHAVAICDWTRLSRGIPHVVQAGIEPIFSCHATTAYSNGDEGGKQKYSGKQSSSDGQLYVRVYEFLMDHPEVEVYILVSGDRDFAPLVSSLRRYGKYVVVMSEEVSLAWDLKAAANESFTFQEIDALTPAQKRGDSSPS
jgi:hypothetical protein